MLLGKHFITDHALVHGKVFAHVCCVSSKEISAFVRLVQLSGNQVLARARTYTGLRRNRNAGCFRVYLVRSGLYVSTPP